MTHASHLRTRPMRALAAFAVLLSALVLIPGTRVADAADETLTVLKSVDHNSIYAGAVSTWTIRVETNAEVGSATGITVTDTVPDGLCPYGAGSADCPAVMMPSPAYTSAVENTDGSWTLMWSLPDMGPSEAIDITYQTLTRSHYREGGADAGPVLARDSWNNMAHRRLGNQRLLIGKPVGRIVQHDEGGRNQARFAGCPRGLRRRHRNGLAALAG